MNSIVNRYVDFWLSKKRIQAKFYRELTRIAKNERIDITYHDDEESLNMVLDREYNKETTAVGIYRWNATDTCREIHLLTSDRDNNKPWTFAHELGHHFSIRKRMDRSEESADKYIMTLANETLEKFERDILLIPLYVYSGSENLNIISSIYTDNLHKVRLRKRAIKMYTKKKYARFLKKIKSFFW